MTSKLSMTDRLKAVQLYSKRDPQQSIDATGLYNAVTFASWLARPETQHKSNFSKYYTGRTDCDKGQTALEASRKATDAWFKSLAEAHESKREDDGASLSDQTQEILSQFCVNITEVLSALQLEVSTCATVISPDNLTMARDILSACDTLLQDGSVASELEAVYRAAVLAGRALNEQASTITELESERDGLKANLKSTRMREGRLRQRSNFGTAIISALLTASLLQGYIFLSQMQPTVPSGQMGGGHPSTGSCPTQHEGTEWSGASIVREMYKGGPHGEHTVALAGEPVECDGFDERGQVVDCSGNKQQTEKLDEDGKDSEYAKSEL